MGFVNDTRGQSVLIGVVLLLAIFVVALSMYQAQVVPQDNGNVESVSYLNTIDDMQGFRGEIFRNVRDGGVTTYSVTTGTDYRSGLLRINPSPARGTIETKSVDSGEIRISNAESINTVNDQGVASVWDGSDKIFETKDVQFTDDYYETTSDDIVHSNNALYLNGSSNRVIGDSPIVDGNTINLYSVNGNLRTSNVQSNVQITTTSQQRESVIIESDGDPITITIPTRLPSNQWEEMVSGDVSVSQSGTNQVELVLPEDTRYELRMGEVVLTEASEGGTVVGTSEATYIEGLKSEEITVGQGEVVRLPFQLRDQFNNPINGRTLNIETNNNRVTVNDKVTTTSSGTGTVVVEVDNRNNEYNTDVDIVDPKTGLEFTYSITVSSDGGDGNNGNCPGNSCK